MRLNSAEELQLVETVPRDSRISKVATRLTTALALRYQRYCSFRDRLRSTFYILHFSIQNVMHASLIAQLDISQLPSPYFAGKALTTYVEATSDMVFSAGRTSEVLAAACLS